MTGTWGSESTTKVMGDEGTGGKTVIETGRGLFFNFVVILAGRVKEDLVAEGGGCNPNDGLEADGGGCKLNDDLVAEGGG